MLIVDAVAAAKGGRLVIPAYHTGHLSLRTGTEITVCLLPSPRLSAMPGFEELVISPVHFNSWKHLTRINAVFHDKSGVVRKLADALRQESLNILFEESASFENGRFHRAEMIVDATVIYAQFEASGQDMAGLLPALQRRLIAVCLNDLALQEGVARLKVRPMEGLRSAWRIAVTQASGHGLGVERSRIERGELQLPAPILELLKQDSPNAILVSDTRDRLLRVLIPPADVCFTYIRVLHSDTIGALFRVTDALAQAFNAVLTLTRLKRQGEQNDIELLLYSRSHCGHSDEAARRTIAESLLASPDLEDLGIRVSYPQHAGGIGLHPHKPAFDPDIKVANESAAFVERHLADQGTSSILDSRIRQYISDMRKTRNLADVQSLRAREEVARQLRYEEGPDAPPLPNVFLSYYFGNPSLADTARGILTEEGLVNVVDGKDPDHVSRPFRDDIVDRIKRSKGFIGIWSEKRISPWLLWELGIAQSFRIPFLIFGNKHLPMKELTRINPDRLHIVVEPVDFRERFERCWRNFVGDVIASDRKAFGQSNRRLARSF